MRWHILILLCTFSLASHATEENNYYTPGDQLEPITLQDQHNNSVSVNEDTRLLLFTTGMAGGKVVRKAIDNEVGTFMTNHHTVFLSNISGMPGMVARMVALPGMRKHSYSILLDRDGKLTERLPSQDGMATIIKLDALAIQSIEFTAEPAVVKQAITATNN